MSHDPFQKLFELEMAGVKPLKSDNRTADLKPHSKQDPGLELRRQAAEDRVATDPNYLTLGDVDMIDPQDPISFCRPGMQHGVYRNLRLGDYGIDATLDLNKHGLKASRKELYEFLQQALGYELRCLLIRHGRGIKANPPGWRKSYVNHWLRQVPEVMAFHSAQPRHGGNGAAYVLLKKGPEAKRHNRERFGKRG